MYQNIIIWVDGSFGSEIAAKYGLVLAKAFGSETIIASTFVTEDEKSRVASSAQRVTLEAGTLGLEVETALMKGHPLHVLKSAAGEFKADLMLAALPSPGVTPRGLRRESVPVRLMRDLTCSVILARVVNCGIPLSHRKILAPLKLVPGDTPSYQELVQLLFGLTDFYGGELTLFTCAEISGKRTYSLDELSRLRQGRREELLPLSEAIMKQGIRPRVTIGTCVSPRKEILDLASKERYDLIVVKTFKPSILRTLLSGDVMAGLLSGTPCNILLWKPAEA